MIIMMLHCNRHEFMHIEILLIVRIVMQVANKINSQLVCHIFKRESAARGVHHQYRGQFPSSRSHSQSKIQILKRRT